MSKSLNTRNLPEHSATRMLLAISLCASMAAFGCTTDRHLGNGDPVTTPGTRSVPTSGTSAGSESEPVPPPMMSSFSNGSVPVRTFRGRLSADEAAAIMAQQQPRVRVLGPVSPGNGGRPYISDRMMLAQQQGVGPASVNSTIYSGPTEVITSGAGEAIAVDASSVVAGTVGSTISGSTSAPTIAGSSAVTGTTTASSSTNVTNAAAPVIAPSGTAITPTSSTVSTPAAFASVRTLSPTAASVVNPPASISGSPAVATASSSRSNTTSNATVSSSSVSPTTSVGVANPVRVQNANGRITITNSGTTRQQ